MAKHMAWWERDIVPGAALAGAATLSFLLQNSPARDLFDTVVQTHVTARLGGFAIETNLAHAVGDGLMAIFFLYVGLELKRECMDGPFRNPRDAALPLCGALGGMVVPALLYLAVILPIEPAYARGWAIPAATDIAFAIGVMSLLGKRVPAGLRLFLLALAIADDLGAIVIIAFFYSSSIAGWAIGSAGLMFAAMLALNRYGVKSLSLYWVLGLAMWAFVALSGVHATIAGVLTALAAPMRGGRSGSPLIAAEHTLKPWVQLGIMPIFALVTAGAPLSGFEMLFHPIALGVMAGLVLGKPIGITLGTFAATRLLNCRMPAHFHAFLGMSFLAGMGFTMSLFIGGLAFDDASLQAPLRVGVLAGSLIAAGIGLALLAFSAHVRHAGDPRLEAMEETAERVGVVDEQDHPRLR